MYPVSESFKSAMKEATRMEHVRGTVGGVPFTDNNIMRLSYSNRCSDTKDVTFGSAYIAELDVSFIDLNIARGTWRGQVITLEYGLELDDEHTTEWLPVGVFTVASAEWTDTGVNIVAYDVLSVLDGSVQVTTTSGEVYDFFNYLTQQLGISFGRTQLEINALPNGTETLVLNDASISTNRDLVSYLAEVVGGFVTSDRTGALTVKSFAESEVVDIIRSRDRVIGSVFSDYSTHYAGISIKDVDSGTTMFYGSESGGYISLGDNPFLQTGIGKDRQREAIATVAQGINYTPFNITMLNNPVYDLGDLITCKGGVAGSTDLTCCVMSIEWQFKHTVSLQGYGADPNLTAGRTKAERAISQMSKDNEKNNIIYHTVANVSPLTISTTPTKLYEVEFVTTDQTTINIEHEFKMLNDIVGGEQTVTLYYYVNGDQVNYEPADTYSEDNKYHLLNGFYTLLNVMGGAITNWEVWAKTDAGTATIDVGDLHAKLWGQKLYAEQGGQIPDLDDSITLEPMPNPIPIGMSETVELDTDVPVGNYLDLHNGTYLELHDGTGLKLHGGN